MNALPGGLDEAAFLRDYWQKKPLLIRDAFPGFEPELDADDIAGLACEELAESRLISGSFPEHDWSLEYGPFRESRFARLPAKNWTLLVQDVEKHYPPLKTLVGSFRFLPNWRIDDLMVSVAAPGGSVGPHVDQYDVFLLQAQGRRRWQIAESYDPALLPDCDLNVLQSFEPEQEWILGPGDMLYLPPGVPHHGVALDECMTWSVGMRAPSAADLLQAMGEWLADERGEGPRYSDTWLTPENRPGELDGKALGCLADLARPPATTDAAFRDFLGGFISRYRLAHQPAPPERTVDSDALHAAFGRGARLKQNPWTRLLWIDTETGAVLFAAGMRYSCSKELALEVCDPARLESMDRLRTQAETELLCQLVNDGHLYLETGE